MPMLTEIPDVLRAAGLRVRVEPGFATRGHGQMGDVRTITCHHTGGLGALGVVRDGRPGLPGPLAHLYLARDGEYVAVAAGLCYHAGVSTEAAYTNEHAIGIEAEATGVDGWPAAQYDAYARGCAALSSHYGAVVRGHKETASPLGRKVDPNFDMAAFRRAVERAKSDAGGAGAEDGEGTMAFSDEAKTYLQSVVSNLKYDLRDDEVLLRAISARVRTDLRGDDIFLDALAQRVWSRELARPADRDGTQPAPASAGGLLAYARRDAKAAADAVPR